MQKYETVFIAPADSPTQKLDDIIGKAKDIIAKAGGEVGTVERWGRRRLAYPIHRHREGFYVFVAFRAPATVPAQLEQFYRIHDGVIRQVTCKAPAPKPAPRVQPVDPAAAAGAPATPAAPAAGDAAPQVQATEAPRVEPAQTPTA